MYMSSSCIFESKSNLYWNPEQPPPSTVTLKHVPSLAICLKRFTQLSLMTKASSALAEGFVDNSWDGATRATLCRELWEIYVSLILFFYFNGKLLSI